MLRLVLLDVRPVPLDVRLVPSTVLASIFVYIPSNCACILSNNRITSAVLGSAVAAMLPPPYRSSGSSFDACVLSPSSSCLSGGLARSVRS